MRKLVKIISVGLVSMLLLAGCGSTKLPDGFDEGKLKEAAKAKVAAVEAGDFEAFSENMTDEVKAGITEETFQSQVVAFVKAKGAFDSFENDAVVASKDPKTEADLGTVVVVAKYAEGKVQYTITFDKDMKLSGFFLK